MASFLDTHVHIRRLLYGAAILIALAVLGLMFGWAEILALSRELLSTVVLIAMEGAPK